MGFVYFSAKEAYTDRLKSTKTAMQNKEHAIYGPANYGVDIATSTKGVIPQRSGMLISESADMTGNIQALGDFLYRTYTIKEDLHPKMLKYATRDDLYLFASMASPEMINEPNIKQAFLDRMAAIQQYEKEDAEDEANLTTQHEEELAEVNQFFNCFKGAVLGEGGSYFPAGYTKDNDPYLQ